MSNLQTLKILPIIQQWYINNPGYHPVQVMADATGLNVTTCRQYAGRLVNTGHLKRKRTSTYPKVYCYDETCKPLDENFHQNIELIRDPEGTAYFEGSRARREKAREYEPENGNRLSIKDKLAAALASGKKGLDSGGEPPSHYKAG